MIRSLYGAALLATVAIQSVIALPQISVKGSKFFANGQQFFLKGVAYQGTPQDPLYDTTQCQADASLMQTIGTNSIRVYHVNPWVNHDGCMSAFEKAGIYVWLDLDTFNTTIEQTAPIWTEAQFLAFAQVMDVFQGYDNLGGFWIGNEVINTASGSSSAPYVKAAVADMKSYMAAKNYRAIPIGYSAADIAELRPMLQNYLVCGSSADQTIDFFGLNSYEWCGYATFQTSGYQNLQTMAENYSIPIFFSETGCNVPEPRPFTDQAAIFGPDMVDTWSGSIIYEWVEETNHYGIVTYPNGGIYSGEPIPLNPDFTTLQTVWKDVSPVGVAEAGYSASFSAPACPEATMGWAINGDVPLPTLSPSLISAAAANQVILPSSGSTSSSSMRLVSSSTVSTSTSSSASVLPSSSALPSSVVSSSSTLKSSSASESSSASTSGSAPQPSPTSQSSSASSTSAFQSSSATSSSSTTSLLSTGSGSASTTASQTSATGLSGTTTAPAATSSTAGSSASSLRLQGRQNSDNTYWAIGNILKATGWFFTLVLPMVGVVGVVAFL